MSIEAPVHVHETAAAAVPGDSDASASQNSPQQQPPNVQFPALVIGGGPAGLMAAEVLALSGHPVVVVDRMRTPGRKFTLAGRGGLNLTHSESPDAFLARYRPSDERLVRAIRDFSPTALRAWAAQLGEGTFEGTSGRVFPDSFGAIPLLRSWIDRLSRMGVTFERQLRWEGWKRVPTATDPREPDGAQISSGPYVHRFVHAVTGVVSEREADVTVLTLGGASWPGTGSDGSWVEVIAASGVAISALVPSNCGYRFAWSEHFRSKHAGKPLKNVAISVNGEHRRGELMITREGLEGGLMYAVGPLVRSAAAGNTEIEVELDLRADVSVKTLAKSLNSPQGSQSTSTWLHKRAHLSGSAIALLRECVDELPREPGELARLIKQVPVVLEGPTAIERAISTAGGISFEELDDHFMLRRFPGVFVAGEMLNWDAPTGGYLLQACCSTGRAAGKGATAWVEQQLCHSPHSQGVK